MATYYGLIYVKFEPPSMLIDASQELLDNRTVTLMVMDDRLDELYPIRRRTAIGLISLDEPCY